MRELQPIYCRQKSFYHKAKVLEDKESIKLISYATMVAEVKNGKPKIYGWYSATTTRHIKEFLKQQGFIVGSKKQLEKMYC